MLFYEDLYALINYKTVSTVIYLAPTICTVSSSLHIYLDDFFNFKIFSGSFRNIMVPWAIRPMRTVPVPDYYCGTSAKHSSGHVIDAQ